LPVRGSYRSRAGRRLARGIAHAGALRAFERHGIPIHCVAGVDVEIFDDEDDTITFLVVTKGR
jgi:hypothetical protein